MPEVRLRLVCGAAALWTLSFGALSAQQASRVPGVQMVEMDGRVVRVQTLGLDQRLQGSPVVVFEAGATNSLEVWGDIVSQVAAVAPVVAYDRAGLGRSEWDGVTPTPRHVTNRLQRLLRQIGAGPPYVLVGYSWGGILARYFAGYHPRDVVGLVLVDPAPIVTQPLADNLAPFNAIGAGQAGYDAYWSFFAGLMSQGSEAVVAEFDVFRGLMQLHPSDRDLQPVRDVPLVVIVAGKYLQLPAAAFPFDPEAYFQADLRHRIRLLQEWVQASSRGTLVMSNHTTHAVTREEPALIVWSVQRLLTALASR